MCLNAFHFGVPHGRERIILIGSRVGIPVTPTPTTKSNPPTVRQALSQLPTIGEPGNDSPCTAKITTAAAPVMRKSPLSGMLFNGAGRPLDLDAPTLTLPASTEGNKNPIIDQVSLDSNRESWIVGYHPQLPKGAKPRKAVPKRLRRLTVRETAALQTFPLEMELSDPNLPSFVKSGMLFPPDSHSQSLSQWVRCSMVRESTAAGGERML